jgi:hypothetical protein
MISRRRCFGSSGFFADFKVNAMSFLAAGCSKIFGFVSTM